MFSRWYFLINLSQKRLFFDIVDRKECFLDLRREILKAQKNGNFPQKHFPGIYYPKKSSWKNCHFLTKTTGGSSEKYQFFDFLNFLFL